MLEEIRENSGICSRCLTKTDTGFGGKNGRQSLCTRLVHVSLWDWQPDRAGNDFGRTEYQTENSGMDLDNMVLNNKPEFLHLPTSLILHRVNLNMVMAA